MESVRKVKLLHNYRPWIARVEICVDGNYFGADAVELTWAKAQEQLPKLREYVKQLQAGWTA